MKTLRQTGAAGACLLLLSTLPIAGRATDFNWNCTTSSFWDITSCWSPNGTPINSTDNVYVHTAAGATANSTLTIDSYTDTLLGPISVSYLEVNNTGTYHVTMNQVAGSLTAGGENIGTSGYGDYTQGGGSHTVTNGLYFATGTTGYGAYTLSNGTLYAGWEHIGLNGTGVFTQSGGTHTVGDDLNLGYYATGQGTYNLNGGNLNSSRQYIGVSGKGYLNQSAGTNTVSNFLSLGTNSGAYGLLNITGGTTSVTNAVHVGGDPNGSGGVGQVRVYSGGRLNAGSLTVWNGNNDAIYGTTGISTGTTTSSTGGIIDIAGALTLQGGGDATGWLGIVDDTFTPATSGIYAATADISGTGSRWDTAGFYTGYSGTGSTTVASGGTVASVYETVIGYTSGSNGTLTVNTAGTVDTNSHGYLGFNPGATGAATVGGTGALWDVAGGLYVGGTQGGSGGSGTLTVNSGGMVQAGILTVWNGSSSIKTGTTTSSTGGIIDIAGALTLQGGGDATGYQGFVDGSYTSTLSGIYAGSANINGVGSRWDSAYHYTGFSGTGTTTVENGGTVKSTVSTYVGVNSGSNGTLIINAGGLVDTDFLGLLGLNAGATGTVTVGGVGALWNVTGGLYVGGGNTASGGTGTLTVNSGGTVQAGSLTVWNGSSSIKTGTTTSSTGGIIDIAGALTLQGGGDATGYIGVVDGSYSGTLSGIYAGSASISGTGTRWDTAGFYTGWTGTGTATVASGGTVASVYETVIGYNNGSNGTLNVNAGGTVDTNYFGSLGYGSGATGTATVGGAGALWDVTNALYVGGGNSGSGGTGTLTVNSGGKVNAASLTVWNGNSSISTGSTASSTGGIIDIAGALTLQGGGDATGYYGYVDSTYSSTNSGIYAASASISGTGSRWDTALNYTGWAGAGTTTVSGGGTLASTAHSFVGYASGSNGTLNVNAGGTVDTNGSGYLAYLGGATGNATVGGTGALWDVASILVIGNSGTGNLAINSGGTVKTHANGFLGFNSGSTGTVTVGGTGALWDVTGGLWVGGNAAASGGTGTLTVNTGGTVTVGTELKLWDNGVANINGGTLNVGKLDIFDGFNFNAGSVNVSGNLSTNGFGVPGSLALGKFSTLTVNGTTTLNDYSTLDINGGSFSTGYLVDNGGFAFNSGTFGLTGDDLTIGASGLFGSNIEFASYQKVNVTHAVNVDSGAILGLNNTTLTAGTYNNNGTVDLVGSVGAANGGTFINNHLLTGNGMIGASLANTATGEVRASSGDTLTFTGSSNSNNGLVSLLGGTTQFDSGLTNTTSGTIFGHGALIATAGLTNDGLLATTAVTDIRGDVVNGDASTLVGDGHIVISGTTTTFYDDVIHNGAEFKVNNGAQAVFFGSYSGAGSFTGTGQLVFAGDLMPGNSPALIDVQGDLSLWGSSTTLMEIGGLVRGGEYDAFDIGGTLDLAGTLDVSWYDLGNGPFHAALGDSFDLFAADTITGSFDLLSLAVLDPGLVWHLDYILDPGSTDYVRLSVAAVPLPAAAWLFGSGVLVLIGVSRRRTATA